MDDSNMQQTAFCEKECPTEPPASKKRKIQSQNKDLTLIEQFSQRKQRP